MKHSIWTSIYLWLWEVAVITQSILMCQVQTCRFIIFTPGKCCCLTPPGRGSGCEYPETDEDIENNWVVLPNWGFHVWHHQRETQCMFTKSLMFSSTTWQTFGLQPDIKKSNKHIDTGRAHQGEAGRTVRQEEGVGSRTSPEAPAVLWVQTCWANYKNQCSVIIASILQHSWCKNLLTWSRTRTSIGKTLKTNFPWPWKKGYLQH